MATEDRSTLLKALQGLRTLKARVAELEGEKRAPIAVVGMACRFPGAPSADAYWRLLLDGQDAIREVPADRWDPSPYLNQPDGLVTARGGFLDDVYGFDADFFGISHREARAMDPQQRLLLETSWHALEDAGRLGGLEGSATGVFMGVALTDWEKRTMRAPDPSTMDMYAGTGSFNSVAAGRISYVLGLRGPNVSIDTACSTSLVTAHLACQSLRLGECDMALAGGVNLLLSPDASLYFSRMGALAPDGHCKAFDASADGYVRAEGVGVLVLRRLDDALADGDRILAVIRGSAINQDGRSNGLTAPSGTAQRAVLREAVAQAGLTAADVGFVEAHGTGTPLGDPIEFDAIRDAYGRGVEAPMWIGAAKTNIGHCEAAAGVAGLVKVVQALHHRQIPPNLHMRELNPRLRVDGTRFRFPSEPVSWTERLAAGVSSFGMSGTNAHLVLAAAPTVEEEPAPTGPAVLTLSAATASALETMRAELSAVLPSVSLHDAAWTLAVGRKDQPHRLAVVASTAAEAASALAAATAHEASGRRSVGLAFDGGGVRDALMTLPVYREAVEALGSRGAVAHALGCHAVLKAWEIRLTAVSGRGAGKLAAAAAAGLLSPEDALAAETGGLAGASIGRARVWVVDGHTGEEVSGEEALRRWLTTDGVGGEGHPALAARANVVAVSADGEGELALVDWHQLGAELFLRGLRAKPEALHGGGRRISLPGTAFEHVSFVLDDPTEAARVAGPEVSWEERWLPTGSQGSLTGTVVGTGPLAERVRGVLPAGESLVLVGSQPLTEAVAQVQAALKAGRSVAVVTSNAADPDEQALWGLARVVAQEAPDRFAGWLQVASGTDEVLRTALDGSGRDLRLDGELFEARLTPVPAGPSSWTASGTWWLTGGMGALGTPIAAWLIERGATRLILTGRSAPSDAVAQQHEAWRATGVTVEVHRADVTDRAAVRAVREQIGVVDGVIHAAGALADAALVDLDEDRIRRVWAAKVDGAANLDEVTRGEAAQGFLTVGSASGRLGIPGQAAYAAANAALHGVVARRREAGDTAVCVDFGPWSGGMADAETQRRLALLGIGTLSLSAGLDQLGRALAEPTGAPIALDLDAELYARRAQGSRIVRYLGVEAPSATQTLSGLQGAALLEALDEAVTTELASVLGREDATTLDRSRGFFDLGLDSMTAVAFAKGLQERTGISIPPTIAFDHGDVDTLVAWMQGELSTETAASTEVSFTRSDEPIAIVGMGCRFPGASDPESFWALLQSGEDAIGPVPASRWDVEALFDPTPATPGRTYVREGAFLDDVEHFDADWFGIAPREAASLDPQQRLLLEVGVEALEDAGVRLDHLPRTRTGVFVGIGPSDYGRRFDAMTSDDPYAGTGNEPSFAAGRLAYVLGVQGPAVGMNTACSTSLVTTHLACQALRDGDCDLALAGGVHLMLSPETTVQLSQLQALSPRSRCRTFDASADGYARGEGAGIVVLKRLADAQRDGDEILALVRGSAVNHDGPGAGLTVPSGSAQQALMRTALARAGVQPEEVGFLEAHGTGTKLGDPIEVGAVKAVYGARPADAPLVMSSIKTHIGHLELAAGVAGIIATVQTLRHRAFAPHLHLQTPNPAMDLDFPVRIPTASETWEAPRRLGAVSSFGLSGTNAHLILEAVESAPQASASEDRRAHVVALSARSEAAVRTLAERLSTVDSLPDAAWTLHHHREVAPWRATVAGDATSLRGELEALARGEGQVARAPAKTAPLVWMFTGQGAQTPAMGRALYAEHAVFREVVDRCESVVQELRGESLVSVLLEDDDRVHRTEWTQPALYALEVGLAALWRSWGLMPDAVIGHSIGEIAAAHVAGVMSLEDGLRMVVERGRRMQALPEGGIMASVSLSESAVLPALQGLTDSGVGAVNATGETVVSGSEAELGPILEGWETDGVRVRRLKVSHAFHSPLMEPMLDGFEAVVRELALSPANIPILSNLTASAEREVFTDPGYWRRHVREAVRFADGLAAAPPDALFLELGPHPVLCGMGARLRADATFVPTLRRGEDAAVELARAVGRMREQAQPVDLEAWDAPWERRRVAVPTTVWQRERHWVERTVTEAEAARVVPGAGMLYRTSWEQVASGSPGRLVVLESSRAEEIARRLDVEVVSAQDVPDADGVVDPRALDGDLEAVFDYVQRSTLPVHWLVHEDETGSMVRGLSRGVAQELPGAFGGVIEVDQQLHGLKAAIGVAPLVRAGAEPAAATLERIDGATGIELSGTWWITGGNGALGLHIARWAAAHGVQRVVLTSRSEPSEARRAELDTLAELVQVDVIRGDLSSAAEVVRILDAIGREGLTGVVHAAGVLADGALRTMSWQDFQRVMPAKVDGARHLDAATRELDLSHFVLLSSAAGVLGWTGQANYGAANAALDGLARQRHRAGLPATSVAYGPWADGGMADPAIQAAMASVGMRALTPATALGLLERALLSGEPDVLAVDLDWETWVSRHPAARPFVRTLVDAAPVREDRWTGLDAVATERALEREVRASVAAVLGRSDADSLDASLGLFDMGLDSLMAVSLARELHDRTGLSVVDTVAFDHPTITALVSLLSSGLSATEETRTVRSGEEPIAIVGMGARFPGAPDPDAFWELLLEGREAITRVPAERWDVEAFFDPTPGTPGRTYVREGGFLGDVAGFEPAVFGISPKEARRMDPQQRLLLEVSWEALEHAGIAPDRIAGSRTGVFVGIGGHDYERILERAGPPDEDDGYAGTGNDPAFAAGRVSYVLGARGPALSLNTACSSSLVATHLGVQALRDGSADLVLAGGVRLMLSPEETLRLSALKALSPTARCHTFDADADGYVRGEGCGIVVLERLSDALAKGHQVLAVVRGTALNHDGASSGLTVPSGGAQAALLRDALADAGMSAAEVTALEAHGTGTSLGDPIEMGAVQEVFGDRETPLLLGSVKTNIGHLELAAGVAGLIKAVQSLQHEMWPPHRNFRAWNSKIPRDFPHELPVVPTRWPGEQAVGVSAFGLSGTNAHVLLSTPTNTAESEVSPRSHHVLTLSAQTAAGLDAATSRLAEHLRRHPEQDLADVAYTLHSGRSRTLHRRAVVAGTHAEAVSALRDVEVLTGQVRPGQSRPQVAFLFTGQGSQYPGMAKELYERWPVFRDVVDRCDAVIREIRGEGLKAVLFAAAEHSVIAQTAWTQPALYAVEVGLAALWIDWGVRPELVIGHSIGELAAAHIAGLFSLEDGLRLVEARGRLMQELPQDGAMAAIFASEAAVLEVIGDRGALVQVATLNGPEETAISGDAETVRAVAAVFESREVRVRELTVSHAFHSYKMDPMLEAFEAVVRGVEMSVPQVPVLSNLTAQPETEALMDPAYWVRHVRQAVRFAPAIQAAVEQGITCFVEVGPHPVLCGLGARALTDASLTWLPSLRRGQPDEGMLYRSAAQYHVSVADLDWDAFDRPARRRVVSLPTTPFQRTRLWVDGGQAAAPPGAPAPMWQWTWEPVDAVGKTAGWWVLGTGEQARAVADALGAVRVDGGEAALAAAVVAHGRPERVLWVQERSGEPSEPPARFRALTGAYLRVVQEVLSAVGKVPIHALTFDAWAPRPDAAARGVWGLARTVALERASSWGGLIDVSGVLDADQVASALSHPREDQLRIVDGRCEGARLTGLTAPATILTKGAVLITGGLGILGLTVAERLLADGASVVVLNARSAPSAEAAERIAAMPGRVEVVRGDVAQDAAAIVAAAGGFGAPLEAIVHAAGVLDDAAVDNLDDTRLDRVARPKVDGVLALDAAAPTVPMVLFSSATAWLGAHGQANYGAANAFLDAFAAARSAEGVRTVSLAFGPWDGAGMASAQLDVMRAKGIEPLAARAAVASMAAAWAGPVSEVAIASADWDRWMPTFAPARRRALLDGLVQVVEAAPVPPRSLKQRRSRMGESVRDAVARTLGLPDASAVDPHQGLFDLGLDSLMAVALVERLEALSGEDLPSSVVFDHPTASKLTSHLLGLLGEEEAVEDKVAVRRSDEPIAIVGLACRFPGAADAAAFWELLRQGVCAIGEAPRERWPEIDGLKDPTPGTPGRTYTSEGGFLDDIASFDASFFGVSPREARAMDPQQRLLLEVSWQALEDAGIAPGTLTGASGGVYVGMGASEYDGRFQRQVSDVVDAYSGTGNDTSFAAGRVSYVLGLNGPAMTVNTACSASLLSVHLAARDLLDGVTDMAVAGGVNLMVSSDSTVRLAQLRALSPTGRCRAFDADADGYVRGEGCGMVVLERLSDARAKGHRVLAVLRGSAINHDGASSALTVPNGTAQTKLLRAAWANAGITGADLGYVEAHGTGTKLGDPIEARALSAALGERSQPLPVGSVKTNIGHLELAAGVAGLIKTVLALHHQVIPPHLHLRTRNPEVPESLPLRFPAAAEPWSGLRIAGVSSFGLSGTNAHLVLEGLDADEVKTEAPARPVHLLCLGARSAGALDTLASQVAERMSEGTADVAWSANRTRVSGHHRVAVAGTASTMAAALRGESRDGLVRGEAPPAPPRMVWLFPGQGEREVGAVLHAFAEHPHAVEVMAVMDARCRALAGVGLLELSVDSARLGSLPEAALVLVAGEILLGTLWQAWGAQPDEIAGHGVGEIAAAWAAGVFDARDAVELAWHRGVAIDAHAPAGRLLAVRADEGTVAKALQALPGARVAAVNDPRTTVVASTEVDAERVREGLVSNGLTAMAVPGAHAFHTPEMARAAQAFGEALAAVTVREAHTPWIAAHSGEDAVPSDLVDGLTRPVRFVDVVRTLDARRVTALVEMGPRPVLLGMARRGMSPRGRAFLSSAMPDRPWEALAEAVGAAWVRGVEIDLEAWDAPWPRRMVQLPYTPFERKRFWVDEVVSQHGAAADVVTSSTGPEPVTMESLTAIVASLLGTDAATLSTTRPLAWQGLDSMMATELHRSIEQRFGVNVPEDAVMAGPSVQELLSIITGNAS